MDSIGLGIFTVVGVSQAYQLYPDARTSLFVLAGVLTGVGGGLIRDIIVNELPQIFRKDIYASASIIGAIICAICIRCRINISVWMILGTIMTTAIRLIAAYKNWELPKTKWLKQNKNYIILLLDKMNFHDRYNKFRIKEI